MTVDVTYKCLASKPYGLEIITIEIQPLWYEYRIFPIVNPNTGEFSGNIAPYNEYYLVAYLANTTAEESNSKVYQ